MSDEEGGSIRRGEDAGLFNLRAILSNASNNGNNNSDDDANHNMTREAAFTQFLDASKEERILQNLIAVQASLTGSDDNDSHAHIDGETDQAQAASTICDFTRIAGFTAVTSEQIIFLARDAAHAGHDLAIDAACIDLHAVQQEPVVSVYLQITNPDAVDEEASPLELTLEAMPDVATSITNANDADKDDNNNADLDPQSVSQTLFDALSALVELHPVDPNDDMMDMGGGSGGGGFGVMAGMGMGGEWMGADGIMDDSDVDDLMVVRAAANGTDNNSNGGGDAHQAMLDRLDNMLEVPDDLVVADEDDNAAVVEGQFDDAEEDEDDAIL
jgi:hypothetical protein